MRRNAAGGFFARSHTGLLCGTVVSNCTNFHSRRVSGAVHRTGYPSETARPQVCPEFSFLPCPNTLHFPPPFRTGCILLRVYGLRRISGENEDPCPEKVRRPEICCFRPACCTWCVCTGFAESGPFPEGILICSVAQRVSRVCFPAAEDRSPV